jgi:FAD/FMN-containing dehydrogenase
VSRWAEQLALPPSMEMVLVLASAPPGAPAGPAGKVVAITAAAFAETEADAAEQLSVLESCPVLERSVVRQVNQASSFEALQEAIGMLLPAGRRYAADSPWLSEGIGSLLPRLAEEIVIAPSDQSVIMAPLLSPMRPGAAPPDAAFSKVDRTILPCYAIWDDEADDDVNEQWLRQTVARVEPSVTGHYIAEADLMAGPAKSATAYAPANWERLAALKRKLDPDDVFHTFLGQ